MLAGLRIATTGKVILGPGDLTLTGGGTSSSAPFIGTLGSTFPTALVLSGGILVVNPGNEIYLNNPLLPSLNTGSATSFVDGRLRLQVTSPTVTARNFPVGKISRPGNVVVGGISGTALEIAVEPSLTAPTGLTAAPLTLTAGLRSYRVQSSSALPATATVGLSWDLDDQFLIGTNPQLFLAQSPAVSGSTALWTARSAASTTGAIAASGSRTSTAGVSLANGEYFGFAISTPSTPDIAMLGGSVQTDVLCIDGTDVITSSVRNLNVVPIDFSVTPMTVAYTVNGITASSTVNTGTLAPLATLAHSSGTYDLSGAAKNISVKATLTGSTITSNDSVVAVFQNRNAFLDFGLTKTFPAGTNVQANLKLFQGLRITEVVKWLNSYGQGVVPSYITTASDFIEISNLGKMTIDLNPIVLEVFGTGARTWSFPAGATLAPGEVAVVHLGAGTDVPASRFYNTGGAADAIGSTSAFGVRLLDSATSYVIDVLAESGSSTTPIALPAGTPAASWNGRIAGTGASLAGLRLSNSNALNQGGAWVRSSYTEPLTIGVLNPGLVASATAGIISWSTPFTGTATTASSAINTSGPLVVTATVAGGSCTNIISDTIVILAPLKPIAAFGPNTQDVFVALYNKSTVVTFTDSTANFPTGWAWSFSPNTVTYVQGTSATSQNPKVVFNNPGIYQAQLIASNITGSDTLVEPITVLPGQAIRVFMRTDQYANEVIYRFTDVTTNKVWVERGPFAQVFPWSAAAATRVDTVLIPQTTNAYEFRFIDTFGDGLVDLSNPNGIFQASIICNWGNANILAGGGASQYGSVAAGGSYDSVVFSIDCRQPATYLLSVDMNQQTVGANGVHVAGNFQGLNPGTTAMTDANGDGIYEYTVMAYFGDTLKYRFINGNSWSAGEVLSAATGSCVVSDGSGNFNRSHAVTTSADSAQVVCWNACSGCDVDVTLKVNMAWEKANNAISANGVHVAGDFQGWSPSTTPMTDANNDGIYEVTFTVPANSSIKYKFINGNTWANNELLSAATGSCVVIDGSGNFNRVATFAYGDSTMSPVCYGKCTDCAAGLGESLQNVNLFPNPTRGQFNLARMDAATEVEVSVLDLQGKVLTVAKWSEGVDALSIDLSSFANGVYMVRMTSDEGSRTMRVSVQK
jgi:PKD repeat protein